MHVKIVCIAVSFLLRTRAMFENNQITDPLEDRILLSFFFIFFLLSGVSFVVGTG